MIEDTKSDLLQSFWQVVTGHESHLIPSARVGHTVHAIQLSPNKSEPMLLLLGGANHTGLLNEALLYSIADNTWTQIRLTENVSNSDLSLARYEHASALLPDGHVLVFGGATQTGPLGDLLQLQLFPSPDGSAVFHIDHSVSLDDNPLSPFPDQSRTQHGSTCLTEHGQLIVFAGGAMGNQPVSDSQVHVYDTSQKSWLVVRTIGHAPSIRFGHVALYFYAPDKTFKETDQRPIPRGQFLIHGGMAEDRFFDDFYQLNFSKTSDGLLAGTWKQFASLHSSKDECLNPKIDENQSDQTSLLHTGQIPSARAAHGGTLLTVPGHSAKIFLFGGVSSHGALNDMHCFDTGTNQWTEIILHGPMPEPRLDFACCLYSRTISKVDDNQSNAQIQQYCFFLHGGMNTEGRMFNDAWTMVLAERSLNANPLEIRMIESSTQRLIYE